MMNSKQTSMLPTLWKRHRFGKPGSRYHRVAIPHNTTTSRSPGADRAA